MEHETVTKADVDAKITTHKGDASAHHTKTGDNEVYGLLLTGTDAGKPAAGIANRWYFATDTLILYRDNGTSWVEAARGETVIRLAQLAEKLHGSLTGIGASDHHAKYTDAEAQAIADARIALHAAIAAAHHAVHLKTLADHVLGTVVPHDALASLTERAHSSLTGIGASDHHAKYTDAEVDAIVAAHAALAAAHHAKFTTTEHDVVARHPLSVLDPAVCSETEADGKITTHKNVASAHHAKTTSASELTSGVLPSIARLPALTSGKIWAGNVSNRPVEENKPAAGPTIATGSYAGNNGDGRQITTGFKCSMAIVVQRGNYPHRVIMVPSSTVWDDENNDNVNCVARQYLHASDGFVVSKATDFMNDSGQTYDYWAISE